jgi:hypothetical protein
MNPRAWLQSIQFVLNFRMVAFNVNSHTLTHLVLLVIVNRDFDDDDDDGGGGGDELQTTKYEQTNSLSPRTYSGV